MLGGTEGSEFFEALFYMARHQCYWPRVDVALFSRALRRVLAARRLPDEHGNVRALKNFSAEKFEAIYQPVIY